MGKREAVLGSFLGDSFALAAHWIYDQDQIEQQFGRIEAFGKPPAGSYHPNKDVGEFTHYGDQAFVLLQSLAEKKQFDLQDFFTRWKTLFKNYNDYVDHATKGTLKNIHAGHGPEATGSNSQDISVIGRIASLAYFHDNLEELRVVCKQQTVMTHNTPETIEATDFFAQVLYNVLHGMKPFVAIQHVAKQSWKTPIAKWVADGVASKGDTRQAIKTLGQSCGTSSAFASTIHVIVQYEDNFKEALIQNTISGGDSAARGMIIGMILGARGVPDDWVMQLKKHQEIEQLLR